MSYVVTPSSCTYLVYSKLAELMQVMESTHAVLRGSLSLEVALQFLTPSSGRATHGLPARRSRMHIQEGLFTPPDRGGRDKVQAFAQRTALPGRQRGT